MSVLVLDPTIASRLKAERESLGLDRYDEVWEGVYVMAPIANIQHQEIQTRLASAFRIALGWDGPAIINAGANVSDRENDWIDNYRIPDVVVVLPDSAARNCGTHWCGGPDLCVEIASPGDRSRDKLDFYAQIGVRELLPVDRDPWQLELYRLAGARLDSVGRSDLNTSVTLSSTVVPITLQVVAGTPRPKIEVVHRDGVQRWLV